MLFHQLELLLLIFRESSERDYDAIIVFFDRTDGGNVSGLGFKVVLTAFRDRKSKFSFISTVDFDCILANKTHPCETNYDEYLCRSKECISSLLKCDGKFISSRGIFQS